MKEYVVTINGTEHTMRLDEDEAKARDAKPVQGKASTPANKSRATSTRNK